jgi:hypothetical protein
MNKKNMGDHLPLFRALVRLPNLNYFALGFADGSEVPSIDLLTFPNLLKGLERAEIYLPQYSNLLDVDNAIEELSIRVGHNGESSGAGGETIWPVFRRLRSLKKLCLPPRH